MLDDRDLEILGKMMREEIRKEVRREVRKEVRKEIRRSENMILKEVDRVQMRTEKELAKLNRKVDGLYEHYRFTKLESENIELLFRLHEELTKRVEKLEKKPA